MAAVGSLTDPLRVKLEAVGGSAQPGPGAFVAAVVIAVCGQFAPSAGGW